MKRFLCALLLCALLLAGCAPNNTAPTGAAASETAGTQPTPTAQGQAGNRFFGMGDNLKYWRDKKLSSEKPIVLSAALGAGTWRNWMHVTDVFVSPARLNTRETAKIKEDLRLLKENGFTLIIGMSHTWFLPEGVKGDGQSVPARNLSEGSDYLNFLAIFGEMWGKMANEFPEITHWEVGNETNMDAFLHPLNYWEDTEKNVFTAEEKALITADMCYTAYTALKKVNPEIVVIFPGLSPGGYMHEQIMENFLTIMYEGIAQGKTVGTREPDEYFDAMCWHPYWFESTITRFVAQNKSVYAVVQKYDGEKPVYFSEFGFTDYGDAEKDNLYGLWTVELMKRTAKDLPWVESVIVFRTLNDPFSKDWAGDAADGEANFGIFALDKSSFSITPKKRARLLQEYFQGTGDLTVFG